MAIAHHSLLLLAALCAGPAVAADPFTPIHQPPPCSAAINRGAQAALDQMASALQVKDRSILFHQQLAISNLQANGRDTGAALPIHRVRSPRRRAQNQRSLNAKAAELTTFAQQRYGCTPLLLMPLP
jgi:hypothetical protein